MIRKRGRVTSLASRARRVAFPLRFEAIERRVLLSTYVVTNTNDDTNAGSLRWAIQQVNNDPTPNTIDFGISGSGTQTVKLTSALPALTEPVLIDGTSQNGYQGSPVIVIDGSSLPGGSNGLTLSAGASTVRGLAIVGFSGSGIVLNSAGSDVVSSNYLGVVPSGLLAKPNVNGISIIGSSSNTVGGTTAGAGNVISANSGAGVLIEYTTTDAANNVVVGNDIGTAPDGITPLGNTLAGIVISGAANNQVGGPGLAGNIISANGGPGIQLIAGASGTKISNNAIGVAANLATPLGNGSDGIQITDSPTTQIGGASPSVCNVIGGNRGNGINIAGASSGTSILGNAIGTDPTGKANLGNSQNGISLGASSNSIGGLSTSAGNLIYHNGNGSVGAGVLLVGTVVGNSILSNSIYSNARLGINLGAGPTDNHNPGTPGPNDYQNYPVLTDAESDGNTTTFQGSLNSTPSTTFLIQFFGSPTEDQTGYGEGKDLLGSTYVQTDGNGLASFKTSLSMGSFAGQFISATATSPSGDTSEFSLDIVTQGQINLKLTGTGTPNPVLAGGQVTYTLTVANNGDVTAHQVLLTDHFPAGVLYVSSSASQGYIVPTANGTAIQAGLGSIGPGKQATVTLVVATPTSMTGTITDTASITSQETDPQPSNESVAITTKVEQAADLSIAMSAAPDPVLQSGTLTYTITVTDLGPTSASNVVVTLPVAAGATYVSASSPVGSTSFANGQVTASLGDLTVSSPVNITVVLQADTAGQLTESASASSDNIDPNPANNQVSVTSDVVPAADLAVAISASRAAAAAGVNLTYSVTVTNNGPADDSNITLTDTLPTAATLVSVAATGGLVPSVQNGVVSVPIALLSSGASQTLTIQVDPTGSPGTSLTDSAAAFGQLADPVSGNNTANLVLPVRAVSDLAISASAGPATVLVGQSATFTITVSNLGTSLEPDAVLTTQLPQNVNVVSTKATQGSAPAVSSSGVLTVDLGALAVNASAVITLVLAPEVDSVGSLSENFTASGQNVDPSPGNNSAAASVTVVPACDLSVAISPGNSSAYDRADWTFSLIVTNKGSCNATGISALAQLPPDVQVVAMSSSQGSAPIVQNGAVAADLGSLAIGGTASVTIVIEPSAVGSMTIGASVSGDQADPNTGNNQASLPVSVSPSVNLAVQLWPSSSTVLTGHNLTFTAMVANTGPSAAKDVAVNLPLGSGLAFVGASASQGSSSLVAGRVVAQLGALAPGAQATLNVVVTPTTAGLVSATASATTSQYQLDPKDLSATTNVTAIESPGVLQFSGASQSVSERAGYAVLSVVRSDGAQGAISVSYATSPGNATSGLDYVPVSGTLAFAAGQTTAMIKVPIQADPWDNHDEYVNVSLSAPLGGSILGAVSSLALRITDVDPDLTPPTVSQLSWSGSSRSISSLALSFNSPLIASLATSAANYRLINLSAGGRTVATRAPVYSQVASSRTFTVTLTPTVPLASGQTYEIIVIGTGATGIRNVAGNPLAGAASGQPGSNYVATFEQGTSLHYVDGSGNQVTLAIKGAGYLEQVRDASGNGQVLTLVGEVPHHTTLSGSIAKVKGRSGRTSLGVIYGLGHYGDVRVQLTSPPFLLRRFPFQKGGHGVL
jgi:uncharacterized repeat protein (TIGR01451 family)